MVTVANTMHRIFGSEQVNQFETKEPSGSQPPAPSWIYEALHRTSWCGVGLTDLHKFGTSCARTPCARECYFLHTLHLSLQDVSGVQHVHQLTSGCRFHVPGRKPRGYFLLLPSHRDSLLIKSVVDADLVLPVDVAGAETPSDPESDAAVSDALSKVSDGLKRE